MGWLKRVIFDNGRWLIELAVNICMAVGTLGFIVMGARQLKFEERNNKPEIDIKVKINNHGQPRLEIHNLGELDAQGIAYILIEPVGDKEVNFIDSEIIPDCDYQLLSNQEKFSDYCFARVKFKLGAGEDPYIYEPCPLEQHLKELTGEPKTTHIVRIESVYQSVKYNDCDFRFTKNYKLIPTENSWSKGRVSLDTVFIPQTKEEEKPSYQQYKEDMKN